ncbi:MAG: hypothetical protein EOP45_15425 [Sphingobacteriaceae bacterium]|nr:MAG: hypothetical protein EOP45_15425 [Sphingobacteriaceae bacterium]
MFQYISDIHLECMGKIIDYSSIIKPVDGSPYLILAGDIGRVFYQTPCRGLNVVHYQEFIKYCAERWQQIFLVIGNHESYGKSIIATRQRVRNIARSYLNVHYMENSTVELPELEIYIAGCMK